MIWLAMKATVTSLIFELFTKYYIVIKRRVKRLHCLGELEVGISLICM